MLKSHTAKVFHLALFTLSTNLSTGICGLHTTTRKNLTKKRQTCCRCLTYLTYDIWVVFLPVARLVFRNLRATDLNLLLSRCDLAEAFLYRFFKAVALQTAAKKPPKPRSLHNFSVPAPIREQYLSESPATVPRLGVAPAHHSNANLSR